MPLVCSVMLFCTIPSLIPFCVAGRLKTCVAIEERHLELAAVVVVAVVDVRRMEGNSTRAVRRRVVDGIIFGGSN